MKEEKTAIGLKIDLDLLLVEEEGLEGRLLRDRGCRCG
jgi:hypothetical protein